MNLLTLRDTWLMLQRENSCSVDRILYRPAIRNAFLAVGLRYTKCDHEEAVLWAVVGLRKCGRLPRVLNSSRIREKILLLDGESMIVQIQL